MKKLFWNPKSVEPALNNMLEVLSKNFNLEAGTKFPQLTFEKSAEKNHLNVKKSENGFTIKYYALAQAGRGIGTALADLECDESTPFESLGVMIDCSRNKVFKIEYLKKYLEKLALMGQNLVLLYTEDTYQLPDEPFFGYLRGAYSLEELQDLDNHAAKLGIELVGCIQTLGHLAEILQWYSAYDCVKDTASVLMVDEPKTYLLIEKMIKFFSKAFRSRRIHIGMDETHDLGRGRFLDRNGYTDGFTLFNRHLTKVNEICAQNGFANPIIWSDMYFRLSNKTQDYYDDSNPIPAEVKAKIPANVQLCYWDYYHDNQEFYARFIQNHRDLGFEPIMGSGVWTWPAMWHNYSTTKRTIVPCINACREKKVKEIFFTMWGDLGAFCQYESTIAGQVLASDLSYGLSADAPESAKRFQAISGDDYQLNVEISDIEKDFDNDVFNVSAYQLWDDPLLAVHYRGVCNKLPDFAGLVSKRCAKIMAAMEGKAEMAKVEYQTVYHLADVLKSKYEFRAKLETAYTNKSMSELKRLMKSINQIVQKLEQFDAAFRISWLDVAKPFGLEVIQRRNAGQIARWKELEQRLSDFINGKINTIEELDDSCGPAEIFYINAGFSSSSIQ